MSRVGREGVHRWDSADGHTVELNRMKEDDGTPVELPYVKLRIAGSDGLGDADNNVDPKVGQDGEIGRPGKRRGKTEAFQGIIRASSARELRDYKATLRQAFSERTELGRMTSFPHPLNPDYGAGEGETYFDARVIGLEMEDIKGSQRFESTFVLGLRNHDGRYFEELTLATFKQAVVDVLSPEVYWPLDSVSGVNDLSGNARHLTATGSPTVGGAAAMTVLSGDSSTALNGSSQYFTSPWRPWALSAYTLMGFFRRDAIDAAAYLFSGIADTATVGLRMFDEVDDVFKVDRGAGSEVDSTSFDGAFPAATARLIELSAQSGEDATIYVDGVARMTASAQTHAAAATAFTVGGSSAGYLAGRLSHLLAFSRLLTPSEREQFSEWSTTGVRSYW